MAGTGRPEDDGQLAFRVEAAEAVGAKIDELDQSFLTALDYMLQVAEMDKADERRVLLKALKEQTQLQLSKKLPPAEAEERQSRRAKLRPLPDSWPKPWGAPQHPSGEEALEAFQNALSFCTEYLRAGGEALRLPAREALGDAVLACAERLLKDKGPRAEGRAFLKRVLDAAREAGVDVEGEAATLRPPRGPGRTSGRASARAPEGTPEGTPASASAAKRPRGRPPGSAKRSRSAPPPSPAAKRPRGRPPAVAQHPRGRPPAVAKRPRGRPPAVAKRPGDRPPAVAKRPRGRPPAVAEHPRGRPGKEKGTVHEGGPARRERPPALRGQPARASRRKKLPRKGVHLFQGAPGLRRSVREAGPAKSEHRRMPVLSSGKGADLTLEPTLPGPGKLPRGVGPLRQRRLQRSAREAGPAKRGRQSPLVAEKGKPGRPKGSKSR
eukprot:jgi/Mesen1/6281/ME000324S05326